MASITNSPFPISPRPNDRRHQCPISSRKRRPIDPPGEEACNGVCYLSTASSLMSSAATETGQHINKRMRTMDDSLELLSLRATDPPGHYSYQSFNNSNPTNLNDALYIDQMVDGATSFSTLATNTSTSCSTPIASTKRPIVNKIPQNDQTNGFEKIQHIRRPLDHSSSGMIDVGNSEMSLEEDICSDNDSLNSTSDSVSESSIRNSMYQVVFGRMKGSSGHGNNSYDAVDAKIEDLIRRSRMEAVLKINKEKDRNCVDRETVDSTKNMDLG